MATITLESVKAKLNNPAISGAPEDQLRGPVEALIRDLAEAAGLPRDTIGLVGETTLKHLQTRPDFAVTVSGALVGFIEIKAPARWRSTARCRTPSRSPSARNRRRGS